MHRSGGFSRRSVLKSIVATGGAAVLTAGRLTPASADANPIMFGLQTELTGALAHDGHWEQKAAQAAVDWHNAHGGIAGRPIKLVTVDTETKPDVGIRRLQQLIQEDSCDFIIGSGHGGVGMGSVPIARDAKVVYMPLARTDAITTELANPYLYRLVSNSSIASHAARDWMVQSIGKRWSIVMADYAFGYSQRDAFTAALKEAGGTLVQSIALPVNVSDPLPYLLKLDRSVDGIIMAVLGPDSIRVYSALRTLGFGKKPKMTVGSTEDLFDVLKLGEAVEGLYALDEVPWELADYPNPDLARTAFQQIGIGPDGRASSGDDYVMLPSAIISWEYIYMMKTAIEGSGWRSRDDSLGLSRWMSEHAKFPASEGMPQGNVFIRPEDQQAFADHYILQIQGGHMRMVRRVPAEQTMYTTAMAIAR